MSESGSGRCNRKKGKFQKKKKPNKPIIDSNFESGGAEGPDTSIQILNSQSNSKNSRPNRYALQFFIESKEEIEIKKEQARNALIPVSEKELEIDEKGFYEDHLGFPKRPPWNFDLSKEQLELQEQRYFTNYVSAIRGNYDMKDLSYFELNLETWRQLWRVLEMSDIILFIVDIRFSAIMFPPSLYKYVTEDLRKDFILVLNKIDLAPAPLVVAWKHYFEENYPLLKICMFTSIPSYNLISHSSEKGKLQVRRRKGRMRMAAEGTQQLYEICRELVGDRVDLGSWQSKIKEEMREDLPEKEKVQIGQILNVQNDTGFYQYKKFYKGVLTIGCIGQPNVGKSSLMNAIMGKKVVSVSKSPGHTKHFQTIFITDQVRLCDCPGLVFPSKVPKPLQILMGSFPIAQVREPYSTIRFLAERLDLVKMLKIQHPYNDDAWSAMDICDGWAKKRGFLVAKASRFDSYRAANNLLRMALDGKICLCFRPRGFGEREEFWSKHPDVEIVNWIRAIDQEKTEGFEDAAKAFSSGEGDSSTSEESDDPEPLQYSNKFAALLDE